MTAPFSRLLRHARRCWRPILTWTLDLEDFKERFWESLPDYVRCWLWESTEGEMFVLGLKEMDDASKKSLQLLKASMVGIVSQKLNTELELPSSWALLEYFLRAKEDPILTIENVKEINLERPKEYQLGNASNNEQKEISDFLSFLHGHGLLLYFDEKSLKTHVILRMQWFSDAFSKLITDKPVECKTKYIKEWKRFDKTGELKNELVDAFWKDEPYSKHKIELMSYMTRLRMIVDVRSVGKDIAWYVPCMNKKPFQLSILKDNWQFTSILSFRMNSFALFEYYRLVADCMSKWTVETDKDGLCLYHTAAIFEQKQKNHTVLIGIHGNDIQVQVRRLQNLDSMVSIEIGKYVENALLELTKTFNEGKTYQKGYKCLNIFCNDEDQTFIPASKFSEITDNTFQCNCQVEEKHVIDVQKTMGYWENTHPRSREVPLEESTDSESRKSLQIEGQTYPFAKEGGPVDVLTSDIKAEVSKSVGLLYIDGQPAGTGFRVGDKYIMTCQHVIKDIVKQDGSIDDTRIRIEFERKLECQAIDPEKMLYFTSTLHYTHDRYDVAILELKKRIDGIEYPPPLTSFSNLQSRRKIHLVGHPGGRQMKEDSEVWASFIYPNNACDNRIEDLKQWSLKNLRDTKNPHQYKDYYSVLRHPPRKILFDTTFVPGASGSPGIMEKNGKPSVVLIMRGGVPECYYEHGVHVEAGKRVEYGYAMEDICEEMKKSSHENIKILARDIFG